MVALEYFTMNEWTYRDDNQLGLANKLSKSERETFFTDVQKIHWPTYLETYILGVRKFLLKEDPSTLPLARKRLEMYVTSFDTFRFSNFLYQKIFQTVLFRTFCIKRSFRFSYFERFVSNEHLLRRSSIKLETNFFLFLFQNLLHHSHDETHRGLWIYSSSLVSLQYDQNPMEIVGGSCFEINQTSNHEKIMISSHEKIVISNHEKILISNHEFFELREILN